MKSAIVLCLCLAAAPVAAQVRVARDTPPPAIANAQRVRDLKAAIDAGVATKDTYNELADLLFKQKRSLEAIDALRGAATVDPAAEAHHRVAVAAWDYVRSETLMDEPARRALLEQAVADEDRALAAKPDYVDALTYKNILLRALATLSSDPAEQKQFIDEADALRSRVLALQRERQPPARDGATSPASAAPFAGFAEPYEQSLARLRAVRVGGTIRTPAKTRDAKPVYPPEAQAARVSGVVILEALIGPDGAVENARVLRSIPLLDASALGAVSQWRFMPTEVDGLPASVIMTVTVNFSLQF